MMLVGDTAQLPPVGEEEAPALQRAVMECYGLRVFECDLSEVVRQEEKSGILWNATMIRQLITHDEATALPRIMIKGFADVRVVQGADLIEALEESYSRVGEEETIVITRSNKRANIYNNGIRMRVVDHEGDLCSGDRIMVVKNHYFEDEASAAPDEDSEEEKRPFNFIANGDMAVVRRVRNVREMYGFRFADLTLRFTDYDDYEMQLTAVLDVLQSDAPAMTAEQRERLFNSVLEDYSFITRKNERLKAVMTDQYYNALQIKFAYAVTCHKAQGGQWRHVYVDQGYMTDDMLTPDYIHWLYTAFTRATDMLSLVNWPENQLN
jgi:ATP-dependent exoDNAse (exonuclease V) alpha subunit